MIYDADTLFAIEPNKHVLALGHGMSMSDAICRILFWGRIRLSKMDWVVRERVTAYIGECVNARGPIRLINSYGGFKAHRSHSAPHINWSEVFHLSFTANWLINLAELYKPGIILEYSGNAEVASWIDNYRLDDVRTYLQEFDLLVAELHRRLPANFTLRTRNVGDHYDLDDLRRKIASFSVDQPSESQKSLIASYLDRARNNVVLDGEEDLTQRTHTEKDAFIKESVLKAYAWYDYDREHRAQYFKRCVLLTNTRGVVGAYSVRSIEGSDKSFWVTDGVLEMKGDVYTPLLLMPDDRRLAQAASCPLICGFSAISPALSRIDTIEDKSST